MTDTTHETPTIVITDTVEHEDGSATYTFEMDDATTNKMAELGLEFTLTCAVHKVDIQDALGLTADWGKCINEQSEGDWYDDNS